jgi:hypothetical protein
MKKRLVEDDFDQDFGAPQLEEIEEKNYDEITIEETSKKQGILFLILGGIVPTLICLLIAFQFINSFLYLPAFIFFIFLSCVFGSIIICSIPMARGVYKSRFTISNTSIEYERTKDTYFKIDWIDFDRIHVKRVFFITRRKGFKQKNRKTNIIFIKENETQRISLSFTKLKRREIIRNLEIYAKKMNKDFIIKQDEERISIQRVLLESREDYLRYRKKYPI